VESIEVGMGKLYIAEAPLTLSTSGIGSCIAVCLWSQATKIGGLAHVMLPKRPEGLANLTECDLRYSDVSIHLMVRELESRGVAKSGLIAKIVGGASMFPGLQARSQQMGQKNIEAVKQILEELKIPLSASEIGGTAGRAVSFDIANGIVTVRMTI